MVSRRQSQRSRITRQVRTARAQVSRARSDLQKQQRAAQSQQQAIRKEQQRLRSQQAIRQIRSPEGLVARRQAVSSLQSQSAQVGAFQQQLSSVGQQITRAERQISRQETQSLQQLDAPTRTTFTLPSGETASFESGSRLGTVFTPEGVAVGTTTRETFAGERGFTAGQNVPFSTPFGEGVDVPGFEAVATTPSGGIIAQQIRASTPIQQPSGGLTPAPREDILISRAPVALQPFLRRTLEERTPEGFVRDEQGRLVRLISEGDPRLRETIFTLPSGEQVTGDLAFEARRISGDVVGEFGFAAQRALSPVTGTVVGEEIRARARALPAVGGFFSTAQELATVPSTQEFRELAGTSLFFAPAFAGGSVAVAQRGLLEAELAAPEITFGGLVFGEQVAVRAQTTIRGIPIDTLLRGQFVRNSEGTVVGLRAIDGSTIPLNQRDTLAIVREIIAKRQRLGDIRAIRDLSTQERALVQNLDQAEATVSTALSQEVAAGIIREQGLIFDPELISTRQDISAFGLGQGQVIRQRASLAGAQEAQFLPQAAPVESARVVSIAQRLEKFPAERLIDLPADFPEILRLRSVDDEIVGIIAGDPKTFLLKTKAGNQKLVTQFDPRIRGIVKIIPEENLGGASLSEVVSTGGLRTTQQGGSATTITTQELARDFPAAAIDLAVKQSAAEAFLPPLRNLGAEIASGQTLTRQLPIQFEGLQQAPSQQVNILTGQQQPLQVPIVRQIEGIQIPQPTQQEQLLIQQTTPSSFGFGGLLGTTKRVGEITITAPGQVEAVIPTLAESQRQGLRTKLLPRFRQRIIETPGEIQRDRIVELPGTRIITTTDTAQRQRFRPVQVPRVGQLPEIVIPTIPVLPVALKIPQQNTFKDTKEKLDKIKGGVNVVVGKGDRKKVVFRNLPPNLALKKGLEHIKGNIRASFVLKRSGKKPKRRDVSFRTPPRSQFRPGKTNALRIVERQTLRLNTAKELSQLAASRRVADRRRKRRGLFGR